ncbi:hypothetical protein [Methanobrevibacter curvatus]|uniref:Uncharacterized protein n=1 Tax=Methanobrevibacter curvatus TaxID=49547 RepID=A0A165Z9C6_9EURY|nr:hypothetical protein [Methanobrevibacter curvatus]KZX10424.1 hypothetical protein MBCUR_17950 [Methanobrevibacter curvatus]
MSIGFDFDQNIDFNPITENFFRNLKVVKWDKKANKLFEKAFSLHTHMVSYIIAEFFSSQFAKNISANRFILTFLVACNAVNHNRDRMVEDDVVIAFKTFYKLIHADIDQLLMWLGDFFHLNLYFRIFKLFK